MSTEASSEEKEVKKHYVRFYHARTKTAELVGVGLWDDLEPIDLAFMSLGLLKPGDPYDTVESTGMKPPQAWQLYTTLVSKLSGTANGRPFGRESDEPDDPQYPVCPDCGKRHPVDPPSGMSFQKIGAGHPLHQLLSELLNSPQGPTAGTSSGGFTMPGTGEGESNDMADALLAKFQEKFNPIKRVVTTDRQVKSVAKVASLIYGKALILLKDVGYEAADKWVSALDMQHFDIGTLEGVTRLDRTMWERAIGKAFPDGE